MRIALLLALTWVTSAHAATLDEVLDAAQDYAPAVLAADAAADATTAGVRWSRSMLGPTVSASGQYLVNNYEIRFQSDGGEVVIQPLHYGLAQVGVTQALSARAIAAQRAADATLDAAAADVDAARRGLVLGVVRAYFDLLVAQEAVDVQRDLLGLAEAQAQLADARAAAGFAEDRAVLQARLTVSRARRELDAATAGYTAAAEALRTLTGRLETSTLEWPTVPDAGDPDATARAEVAAASARLDAAQRRVRSAWTLWVPDLSAGLNYSWSGNAGFGRNDLLQGVAGATWNLPAAGAHVHQRAAWLAEARLAEADLRAVSDTVGQQVATARAELSRARTAEAAMADELALAERSHTLTVRAFELGTATALEVDEAVASVRAARLGALRERANVAVATYGVLWAEGRLSAR